MTPWRGDVPAPAVLNSVEYRQSPMSAGVTGAVSIVAYNIERGRNLDAILGRWPRCNIAEADIVLLSEADRGMARTRNRHITREFAEALGFSWAYGVEYVELTKGDRRERRVAGENREANIGNAILSRFPIRRLENLRLPAFVDPSRQTMARLGSRSALLGDIDTGATAMTVASAHLESDSSPDQRAMQMQTLLAALETRDHGQPIVIGGDMNTSGWDVNRLPWSVLKAPKRVLCVPSMAELERCEPLFGVARAHGFDYRPCNRDGHTFSDRGFRAHLDWFFTKNIPAPKIEKARIYQAFRGRRQYSDHLPIGVSLAFQSAPGG